ncbi:unnamed protein product [Durusdinium trenchii]|uniref:Uncharacterized protein n=1 Tax=Durusdinium trenchii TaxID=1381693 RepID=A0ABP0QAF3_9DINO
MVTIPPLPHGAWPDLAPEFVAPERHRGDLGAQRPRARRSSGASKKAASKKPTKVPPEAFTALFHARCCHLEPGPTEEPFGASTVSNPDPQNCWSVCLGSFRWSFCRWAVHSNDHFTV